MMHVCQEISFLGQFKVENKGKGPKKYKSLTKVVKANLKEKPLTSAFQEIYLWGHSRYYTKYGYKNYDP